MIQNVAMISVLTLQDYCEMFSKKSCTAEQIWLVQRVNVKHDTEPWQKFIIMRVRNVWLIGQVAILPQQNLNFDREKNLVPLSKFYYTENQMLAIHDEDHGFDEIYLAATNFYLNNLKTTVYPL